MGVPKKIGSNGKYGMTTKMPINVQGLISNQGQYNSVSIYTYMLHHKPICLEHKDAIFKILIQNADH